MLFVGLQLEKFSDKELVCQVLCFSFPPVPSSRLSSRLEDGAPLTVLSQSMALIPHEHTTHLSNPKPHRSLVLYLWSKP